mmetsp:Transcript_9412/g.32760  ORF Transcript_9412/g.32760 Transcript_9412/m.32760 type:complete len:512 (+) Transcript_9412:1111-2646(+)
MLAQHCHHRGVRVPHYVLDQRRRQLSDRRALLHVVQHDLVLPAAQQRAGARVEDGVHRRAGGGAFLRHLVAQVLDQDLAGGRVQHGEAVARDEGGVRACPALGVASGLAAPVGRVARDDVQLVRPAVRVAVDEHRVLRGVVAQGARRLRRRVGARPADGDERVVAGGREVVRAQVAVLDVVQRALVRRARRALPLQLEHDHARVVASRQQVHVGVRAEDPEAVVLAAERLHAGALAHVPHADGLVLGIGHDDVLPGVEHDARHVVHVAAQRVHLPRLGVVHAPQLHLAVVRARDDQRQGRVEARPVHAPVVALQHVLHHGVPAPKQVRVHLRDAQEVVRRRHRLLAQPRDVPDPHRLVKRGADDQVLLGVEGGAHHVVVVPRKHADARAALPVPYADRLVVRRGHDPGVLLVELHGADVVEVAQQREEAAAVLVVPDLDLVVVAAGDEERLRAVEVDAAHGAVVLVEAVNQRAHAVVPQLDHAAVQGREDPWPLGVKGQALHAVALGLELS